MNHFCNGISSATNLAQQAITASTSTIQQARHSCHLCLHLREQEVQTSDTVVAKVLAQKPYFNRGWSASAVKWHGRSLISCTCCFCMRSWLSPRGVASICVVLSCLAAQTAGVLQWRHRPGILLLFRGYMQKTASRQEAGVLQGGQREHFCCFSRATMQITARSRKWVSVLLRGSQMKTTWSRCMQRWQWLNGRAGGWG